MKVAVRKEKMVKGVFIAFFVFSLLLLGIRVADRTTAAWVWSVSVDSSKTDMASAIGEDYSPPVVLSSERSKGLGDSLWGFDCEGPSGDDQCLGVEFDGTYFYITGAGGMAHPDTNKLHIFDRDGNYITSLNQPTTSDWGWRDIAWDGNHFYSSDDSTVTEWYVTGLPDDPVLNVVGTFPGPLSPNRALAYDPATDHFWTANWDSGIYEFDRTGTVINQYPFGRFIFGMAWDTLSPEGPWLWAAAQNPDSVYRLHPAAGIYRVSFPTTIIAGGCAFNESWHPAYGILFYLAQSDPDHVIAYEICFTPLDRDVGVLSIDNPGFGVQPNLPLTPQATVKNYGPSAETFDVSCEIDSSTAQVYTTTQTVDTLASGATRQVAFVPDWTPDGPNNIYTVTVYTQLAGDAYPGNDTLSQPTMTYSYYEHFDTSNGLYDPDPPTGAWEWGPPTSGPWIAHSPLNCWATVLGGDYSDNANWRLDSRDFICNLDNPALEFWQWYDFESGSDGGNVKVSTDFGATWEIVNPVGGYPGVAPGFNSGIPDEPYYTGNSGGWRLAHFELSGITSGTHLRIRWHFGSDGAVTYPGWYIDDVYGFGFEPWVGIEETQEARWHPATWLGTGMQEARLEQSFPNPFTHTTTIRYAISDMGRAEKSQIALAVHDVTGRLVRTIADEPQEPGYYSVIWNGKDSSGRPVPGGIYFCRLTARPRVDSEGYFAASKKVVLLR